jgi:hypothetical protein
MEAKRVLNIRIYGDRSAGMGHRIACPNDFSSSHQKDNLIMIQAGIQKKPTVNFILYMFLSFFLSLIFFVLMIVGLALGVSTFILWIGVPLLIGSFAMIRGMGTIERSLVRELLGVSIAGHPRNQQGQGLWKSLAASIMDPLTWKSVLYFILKLPISIIFFSLTLTFLVATLGLLLAPLGYAIATFVLQINGIHLQNTPPVWLPSLITLDINGQFEPMMFFKSFIFTAIGIAFWFLTRSIIRGIGNISATLASTFLSPVE